MRLQGTPRGGGENWVVNFKRSGRRLLALLKRGVRFLSKIMQTNKSYIIGYVVICLLSVIIMYASCAHATEILPIDKKNLQIQRTEQEITQRIIALLIVGAKGYGMESIQTSKIIQQDTAHAYFTEDEYIFLHKVVDTNHPITSQFYEYQWRIESACTLLWATGYLEEIELENPVIPCNPSRTLEFLNVFGAFRQKIKTRPIEEISYITGLYSGYEFATRSERILNSGECIDRNLLHPAIVYWRYLALQWLLGREEW